MGGFVSRPTPAPAPAPAAPDGGISSRAPPPPRDVRRFVVTGPRVVRRDGGRGGMITIGKEEFVCFWHRLESGMIRWRAEPGVSSSACTETK